MPANHRFYSQWSPERVLRWARSIGGEVVEVIEKVLKGRKHPEQAFRVCLGILSLAKKYGDKRLNKACKRANQFGTRSFKWIESTIELGLEEEKHPQLDLNSTIPDHENIRGGQYYS